MQGRVWYLMPILWVQGFLVSPDLLKIPVLVAHYFEHQATTEGLDLSGFLALHYANDDHQAADHDGHENLPFHHHHGAAVDHHTTQVLGSEPMRPVSFPELSARVATALPEDDDLLAGHQAELLRPPRTRA
ncbi:MAG: hypothetical protein ACO1NQ_03785 [Flavobacteriales bacterium]